MQFHWNKGCLPKDEWKCVAHAMKVIGDSIMIPYLGGFKENLIDYWAVDFIAEPDEIKEALEILIDFANTL